MSTREIMPSALREQLRFRLQDLLIRDDADYESQMTALAEITDELCTYAGKLKTSPENVHAFFKLLDQFEDKSAAVIMYSYLAQAIDTRKAGLVSTLYARLSQFSARLVFGPLEIKEIDEATWAAWTTKLPALAEWNEAHRQLRKDIPFTLSKTEEELLAKLDTPLTGWQNDFYETLLGHTEFEEFEVDGKTLNAMRDSSALLRVKDRDLREKAWQAFYKGYNDQRDMYAFSLSRLISTINTKARIRHFDDALHSQAHNMDLTREQVEGLFTSVEALQPLLRRYQQADCKRRSKLLGIAEIEPWDMEQEDSEFELPTFHATDAFTQIKDALAILGDDVSRELKLLLDPTEGRVDMYGGPNRTPGAFSINVGRRPGFFYLDQYHGTLNQVRTIAHEAGHTVHFSLMKKQDLPLYTMNGPSYVTETAAMTFEEILQNYVIAHCDDAKVKEYFEFEQLRGTVKAIRIGYQAMFENKLYAEIRDRDDAGKAPMNADEFDEAAAPIADAVTLFYGKYPKQYQTLWQYIPHLHGVPQYLVNYLVSSLLTLELVGRLDAEPAFAKSITKLFSQPFDRPTAAMLKDCVDIDFSGTGWYSHAVKRVEERVLAFEKKVATM